MKEIIKIMSSVRHCMLLSHLIIKGWKEHIETVEGRIYNCILDREEFESQTTKWDR